jgi:hypothetical protein
MRYEYFCIDRPNSTKHVGIKRFYNRQKVEKKFGPMRPVVGT